MNNENHRRAAPDVLDAAVEALRVVQASDHPPADLVASTLREIGNRFSTVTPAKGTLQRRRVLRCLGYGSLALAATGLVCVALLGIGGGSAAAFDKALQKVEQAAAVRFRMRTTYRSGAEQVSDVMVHGNKLRVDGALGPGTTWVIDWDAKEALMTDAENRTFQTVDMSEGGITPVDSLGINFRDELLALKNQKARHEGTETVDGETADRYVVKGGTAFHTEGDWEVWVGRVTMLPVKVGVTWTLRGITTSRVYEAFDWNPKPDAAAFAIDPPAGFEEKTILRLFPPLPPRKKN